MKRLSAALPALLLAACASTPNDPSKPPETEITILDESGEAVLGEVTLWKRGHEERCAINNESCGLEVKAGDYSLTFRKLRSGSFAMMGGGGSGTQRSAGCLRAQVTVTPGEKIVCKKASEYSCERGNFGRMDCGKATAKRYGYDPTKPAAQQRPEDEEQDDVVPDRPAQPAPPGTPPPPATPKP